MRAAVKNTVVLGLGNILMSDEGIGVRVVERLQMQAAKFPDVECIDAGTGGMNILHLIANRKRAIIVDCALMGQAAGTIRRFTPDDVQSVKAVSHFSLHDVDILKVLELSRQLEECPAEVVIFGIEPAKVEQGDTLSPQLAARIDEYVTIVGRSLAGS
jgi:hydrogenase maturation protease